MKVTENGCNMVKFPCHGDQFFNDIIRLSENMCIVARRDAYSVVSNLKYETQLLVKWVEHNSFPEKFQLMLVMLVRSEGRLCDNIGIIINRWLQNFWYGIKARLKSIEIDPTGSPLSRNNLHYSHIHTKADWHPYLRVNADKKINIYFQNILTFDPISIVRLSLTWQSNYTSIHFLSYMSFPLLYRVI